MPDGFLLIDKPEGWTSHDVVARVRRILGMQAVGHAGTLDPFATGLLVLGVGKATRLLRFVSDQDKTYAGRGVLGIGTTTADPEGEVNHREPLPVARTDLEAAMASWVGAIEQVPPMASAISVKGVRLHRLARQGIQIERQPRAVTIFEFELLGLGTGDFPEFDFRVRCSKGTYIRSLVDDLATGLGGHGHLLSLRRLAVGPLLVEASVTLAQLEANPQAQLLSPAGGLVGLPMVAVGEGMAAAVAQGRVIPCLPETPAGHFGVVDPRGKLLGVYNSSGSQARAEVVLR